MPKREFEENAPAGVEDMLVALEAGVELELPNMLPGFVLWVLWVPNKLPRVGLLLPENMPPVVPPDAVPDGAEEVFVAAEPKMLGVGAPELLVAPPNVLPPAFRGGLEFPPNPPKENLGIPPPNAPEVPGAPVLLVAKGELEAGAEVVVAFLDSASELPPPKMGSGILLPEAGWLRSKATATARDVQVYAFSAQPNGQTDSRLWTAELLCDPGASKYGARLVGQDQQASDRRCEQSMKTQQRVFGALWILTMLESPRAVVVFCLGHGFLRVEAARRA